MRAKLLTLINFCLFPEMAFRVLVKILRLLHNHSACEDILENLFRHHPDQHRLLVSFIRRLVADSKNREPKVQDETETEDCKSFYSSLEAWNLVKLLIHKQCHYWKGNSLLTYKRVIALACVINTTSEIFL